MKTTFACPGGCGLAHPIGAGHLVMSGTLVVILCEPCTVALVLARAGRP